MMRSVSKNIIGKFDLQPSPLYTGLHGQIFQITNQANHQTLVPCYPSLGIEGHLEEKELSALQEREKDSLLHQE